MTSKRTNERAELVSAHCPGDFQPVSPRDAVVRRDDEEALNRLARRSLPKRGRSRPNDRSQ